MPTMGIPGFAATLAPCKELERVFKLLAHCTEQIILTTQDMSEGLVMSSS